MSQPEPNHAKQNRLRETLSQSEDQYRLLVDTVPYGIQECNTDGIITFANAAYAQMHDCEVDDLIGKPIWEMLESESARQDLQDFFLLRIREQPSSVPYHRKGRTLSGRLIEVQVDWAYKRNRNGQLLGLVSVLTDISEKVQAEEELRQHRDNLSHVARLNSMAELATELAHELNQPLGAILLYASAGVQALNEPETVAPEHLTDLFERLMRLATQSGEIIRKLRRLVGKEVPVVKEVDLDQLIQDVLGLFKSDLRFRNIQVKQKLEHAKRPVLVDEIQIQQVLLYLIDNALDALSDQEAHERMLEIRTAMESDHRIAITVCDNGSGIPAESQEQIFDAFFTTKKESIGMGLTICRTIVESHDGELSFYPNTDRGSSFHFSIPISRDDAGGKSGDV